jgi:phage shock protein C
MQSPGNQSFFRGSDRIIGGVCSGLAEGFHVEVLWVRLAFVVLAFVNGIGLLLYIVLWVLMPERTGHRPAGTNVFESMAADLRRAWADLRAQFGSTRASQPPVAAPAQTAGYEAPAAGQVVSSVPPQPVQPQPVQPQPASRNPSFIFGAILIAIGIAFLAANTGFVDWSVIWPAALVVLGIFLLVRNLEKKS